MRREENVPNDSRLNGELAILIDSLQDLIRIRFFRRLDRLVQIDLDLLRLEV
jgi:hypothetical protein